MEEIKNCGYDQSGEDSSVGMGELRRGPWTVEEDFALMNYIAHHGEGRWNALSGCAGLKRTGKSCRLRWLNYLRPDVRRGNITLEEQLLILELHSRWGNRWSKIAQHLPGRTDNEIKNYWRTRVQKHAKQLKCDVNSKQFKDTMRYLWMPRLVERIQATSGSTAAVHDGAPVIASSSSCSTPHLSDQSINTNNNMDGQVQVFSGFEENGTRTRTPVSEQTDLYHKNLYQVNQENGCYQTNQLPYMVGQQQQEHQSINSQSGYEYFNQGQKLMDQGSQWINGEDWYLNDEMWFLQLQDQQNSNPLFSFS